MQTSYYLVVGEKEQTDNKVTVESRAGRDGAMTIDDFINKIKAGCRAVEL